MQRVMIIGQPGSGKSTLARAVGEIAHLPVFHIDLIHWQPGWVPRDAEEKDVLCSQVHALDRWVFEGGHSRTWPERLARADTVIWLDLPLGLRLWRVTARTLRHRGQSRPDLPQDCPEYLDLEFYRFIWRTRTRSREKCAALFESAREDQARHHFTSAKAVRGYLHALRYVAKRGNLGISHR